MNIKLWYHIEGIFIINLQRSTSHREQRNNLITALQSVSQTFFGIDTLTKKCTLCLAELSFLFS